MVTGVRVRVVVLAGSRSRPPLPRPPSPAPSGLGFRVYLLCSNIYCVHFAGTMDPPSPICRDLDSEHFLEDMIHDADEGSPSRYLNSSGEGEETNRQEEEAHGRVTQTDEVYIYDVR